jgi:hypothetical protein
MIEVPNEDLYKHRFMAAMKLDIHGHL